MLGKERLGEVNKIGQDTVVRVRPKACELKGIARFAFLCFAGFSVSYLIASGAVGVVLGVCAV